MDISRRTLLTSALAGGAPNPSAGSRARPWNVLFLLSDQHKAGAFSVEGDACARTPALDALARSGLRFRNAYCANPVCGPARASIWTGLHTHNHGVLANEVPWPVGLKSFVEGFRNAGYHTAAIGKMHFADAHSHGFDYRLDFNDWYQYLGPKAKLYADEVGRGLPGDGHPQIASLWRESGDPWQGQYARDGREAWTHLGRPSLIPEKDHFDSFVARETLNYLRQYAGQGPFFAVASFMKPHQPFMPAERFARMFSAADMRLPATFGKVELANVPQHIRRRIAENPATPELLDPNKALQRIASYYGCLAQMDDCAASVLAGLRELGLEDRTIVVYTSDHGEMLGEHGLWQKFVFYESSVRVPLILRVPGTTVGGAACQAPVSHVQLAATLLELCGIAGGSALDGASLAPYLRETARPAQGPVFAEFDLNTPRPKFMIREGDWKYCRYAADTPELYNLCEDPEEMRNLAGAPEYRERAAALAARMRAWHAPAVERTA
jgi:choline-sulfatase